MRLLHLRRLAIACGGSQRLLILMTVVRSSIVSQWPGKVSGFTKEIMKIMFCQSGCRFPTGVVLVSDGRSFLLQANFAGFLRDKEVLKEIGALKGRFGKQALPDLSESLAVRPGGIACRRWARGPLLC